MSDQDSQSGEKEFDATEQRLRQARQDGNVAQSKEANALALVVGLIVALLASHAVFSQHVFELLSASLGNADAFASDIFNSTGTATNDWLVALIFAMVPVFAIMAVFVLLALIVQRAITFSFKSIKPDMKKLSPAENLKKKYGAKGLTDFLKDTAKMLFAAGIAGVFLFGFAKNYFLSSAIEKGQFYEFTFVQILTLVGSFALFQFVLAAIDLPLQQQLYAKRMKMTREEVKKEHKQNEGDPLMKQARRKNAAKISRGEMLQNVKESTVVMVNPEHYAVALKWDPNGDRAPVCVAKGVDHMAARIREVAMANNIPIYRDPPSTRSIYRLVDIDEEIHQEHFAAVAAAIQFVDRITQTVRERNDR